MGNSSSKNVPLPAIQPHMPYKATNKKCTVGDRAYLEFRLAQMHYCSYILEVLRVASTRTLDNADLAEMIDILQTYHGPEGPNYSITFDVLVYDPTLQGPADRENVFATMANYLNTTMMRSPEQVKNDIIMWYGQVSRIKDFVALQIARACR